MAELLKKTVELFSPVFTTALLEATSPLAARQSSPGPEKDAQCVFIKSKLMSGAVCLGQHNYAYYICKVEKFACASAQVRNANESDYRPPDSIEFVPQTGFSNEQ